MKQRFRAGVQTAGRCVEVADTCSPWQRLARRLNRGEPFPYVSADSPDPCCREGQAAPDRQCSAVQRGFGGGSGSRAPPGGLPGCGY